MAATPVSGQIMARRRAAELLAKAEDLIANAGFGMSYDLGNVQRALALTKVARAYTALAESFK